MVAPLPMVRYPILLPREIWWWGSDTGELREWESRKNRFRDKHQAAKEKREKRMERSRISGATEVSVAVLKSIPYQPTVNTFKSLPDVGDCEVRYAEKNRMVIRPDPEEGDGTILHRPFVCVQYPERGLFNVRGWIYGKECLDHNYEGPPKGWLGNPNNSGWAWFVPVHELHAFSTPVASSYTKELKEQTRENMVQTMRKFIPGIREAVERGIDSYDAIINVYGEDRMSEKPIGFRIQDDVEGARDFLIRVRQRYGVS